MSTDFPFALSQTTNRSVEMYVRSNAVSSKKDRRSKMQEVDAYLGRSGENEEGKIKKTEEGKRDGR